MLRIEQRTPFLSRNNTSAKLDGAIRNRCTAAAHANDKSKSAELRALGALSSLESPSREQLKAIDRVVEATTNQEKTRHTLAFRR